MNNCVETCLDSIVTVSDFCNGEKQCSLSGYDIMDAPEITVSNLSAIANEKYISGLNLARSIVKMAINNIKNDFIAVLNTNNYSTDINSSTYTTSYLNQGNGVIPAASLERGMTLFRNPSMRGKLRKMLLRTVDIYPVQDAQTTLMVYDNGQVSSYSIQLIGGQINTFDLDYLVQGSYVRVVIDCSMVDMYSTKIICKTGCNGTSPNPCAYVESYDGTSENRSYEGYGLNISFSCKCDYTEFLCDLSQSYIGELIYMKSRIMLLDERLRTNRFNDWIIYSRDEIVNFKAELQAEYVNKWNAMVDGLYGVMKNYHDECIICKGIRWVVNG